MCGQGGGGTQIGDERAGVQRVVFLRVRAATLRVREPSVHHGSGQARPQRLVAEQRDSGRGLHQPLADPVHDLGRRIREAVEHSHEAWADVVVQSLLGRDVVPGEAVEVVALGQGQAQPAGHRREHLRRRLRPALLLEASVVVGGHAAQRGDLLTPETTCPTARPPRQADVLRLERLPPGTQEVSELDTVHGHSLAFKAACRRWLRRPGPIAASVVLSCSVMARRSRDRRSPAPLRRCGPEAPSGVAWASRRSRSSNRPVAARTDRTAWARCSSSLRRGVSETTTAATTRATHTSAGTPTSSTGQPKNRYATTSAAEPQADNRCSQPRHRGPLFISKASRAGVLPAGPTSTHRRSE